jgi:hypothetical protein
MWSGPAARDTIAPRRRAPSLQLVTFLKQVSGLSTTAVVEPREQARMDCRPGLLVIKGLSNPLIAARSFLAGMHGIALRLLKLIDQGPQLVRERLPHEISIQARDEAAEDLVQLILLIVHRHARFHGYPAFPQGCCGGRLISPLAQPVTRTER